MANENEKPIETNQENSELPEQELANVAGGVDPSPKETVTLNYGSIQFEYTQQK
jgi:type VI protein secretion system component Hcp